MRKNFPGLEELEADKFILEISSEKIENHKRCVKNTILKNLDFLEIQYTPQQSFKKYTKY